MSGYNEKSEHLSKPSSCVIDGIMPVIKEIYHNTETTIDYKFEKLIADTIGSATSPAISFSNDTNTGWYWNSQGEVCYTSNGSPNIIYNPLYTMHRVPLVLEDSAASFNAAGGGILYKKAGSDGIWWKTGAHDVNLAEQNAGVMARVDSVQAMVYDVNRKYESLQLSFDNISGQSKCFEVLLESAKIELKADINDKIVLLNNKINNVNQLNQVNDDINNRIEQLRGGIDENISSRIEQLRGDTDAKIVVLSNEIGKLSSDDKINQLRDEVNGKISGLNNDDKINQLRDEIGKLNSDDKINQLRDEMSKLNNDDKINQLRDEIGRLSSDDKINQLRDEVNGKISTLNSDDKINQLRDEVNGKISTLNSNDKINQLHDEVNGKISELNIEDKINQLRDEVNGKISELNNEDKINQLRDEISKLSSEDKINQLRDEVNGKISELNNEDKINQLRDDVNNKIVQLNNDNLNGKLVLLDNKIGNVNTNTNNKITLLDNKVNNLNTNAVNKINRLDESLKNIRANIDTINNKLAEIPAVAPVPAVVSTPVPDNSAVDLLREELNQQSNMYHMLESNMINQQGQFQYLTDSVYRLSDEVVGLKANDKLALSISDKETAFYNTLVVKDTHQSTPSVLDEGHLYKKPNNPSLFWSTKSGESDLSKPSFPLLAADGDASNPSYSFESYPTSGLYMDYEPAVHLTIHGQTKVMVKSNSVLHNVPIQIEPVASVDKSLNDVLYNADNSLHWKSATGKVDLLKDKPFQFIANGPLQRGDVVGILQDHSGYVDKVSGGKWFDKIALPVPIEGGSNACCDTYDATHDLLLYTTKDILHVSKITNNNVIASTQDVQLADGIDSCVIVKISDVPKKYALVCGVYGNTTKLHVYKICVDADAAIVESTVEYATNSVVETFDAVYDLSDMLIIAMYNNSATNIDVVVMKMNTNDASSIMVGYHANSILTTPIISDGLGRKLKLLLIPGQVVVCSFCNIKSFILLSNDYNATLGVGECIIDTDSINCVDMIYDINNGVVISVEQTISNTCFMNIIDIYGTRISILKSKRLNGHTAVPLGISYNNETGNFVLVYTSGRLKAHLFQFDGEDFNMTTAHAAFDDLYEENDLPCCNPSIYTRTNGTKTVLYSSKGVLTCMNFTDADGAINPSAYIGFVSSESAAAGEPVDVMIRGRIYHNEAKLRPACVGKKIYLDSNSTASYPANLTLRAVGNVSIGTVLSVNDILVGM